MFKRPPGLAKRPGGGPREPAWRREIDRTTRMILGQILPHYIVAGPARKAEARRAVIAAARVALSDAADGDLLPVTRVAAQRIADGDDETMSPEGLPGLYRTFLIEHMPSWRSAIGAESAMLVVQRCLDRELADRPLADDRSLVGKIRTMAAFGAMGGNHERSTARAMEALGEVIGDPLQLEAAGAMFRAELDRVMSKP